MMILAGAALLATSAPAFAGNDRPIAVGELPAVSQEFIKTHFAGVEVSFSKVDEELFDKDYKVVFVNGAKSNSPRTASGRTSNANTARCRRQSFRSRSAIM